MMKDLTIGQAEFARDLARRAHAEWFRRRDGENSARGLRERTECIRLGMPSHEDQARLYLLSFISTLPDGARADLNALFWLGRGDYDAFEDAREAAESVAHQVGLQTAIDLASEAPFADYLDRGLRRLRRAHDSPPERALEDRGEEADGGMGAPTVDQGRLEEWGRQVAALSAAASRGPCLVAAATTGTPEDFALGIAWAADVADRSRALLLEMALAGLMHRKGAPFTPDPGESAGESAQRALRLREKVMGSPAQGWTPEEQSS